MPKDLTALLFTFLISRVNALLLGKGYIPLSFNQAFLSFFSLHTAEINVLLPVSPGTTRSVSQN